MTDEVVKEIRCGHLDKGKACRKHVCTYVQRGQVIVSVVAGPGGTLTWIDPDEGHYEVRCKKHGLLIDSHLK